MGARLHATAKKRGAPAWSPLANGESLQGWYDASDAASLEFSDATTITRINDKSGLGNHLAAASGKSPKYHETLYKVNGRKTIQFYNGNRCQKQVVSPILSDMKIHSVWMYDSAMGVLPTYFNPPFGMFRAAATNLGAPWARWQTATLNRLYIDDSYLDRTHDLRGRTVPYIYTQQFNEDGLEPNKHYVMEKANKPTAWVHSPITDVWDTSGQTWVLGERLDGTSQFVGRFCEAIVLKHPLTQNEDLSLFYLADKWGITL